MRVLVFVALSLGSTVVLTPLEVISTRLAIQRNHEVGGEFATLAQEDGQGDEFAGDGEDVIGCVFFPFVFWGVTDGFLVG